MADRPRLVVRHDTLPIHSLREWFDILPPAEQDYIRGKLGALIHLMRLEVSYPIIQSLLQRWSPVTYTFHFPDLELAPTYEEYLHLAELPHVPGILPYSPNRISRQHLAATLRTAQATVAEMFHPQGYLSIQALLRLRSSPVIPGESDGQTSARGFIILFSGLILHPNTATALHPRAAYIAWAIIEGRPFIPNLIGDTNYGLTRAAQRHAVCRGPRLTCCVALLHAWFATHLGVLACHFRVDAYPGLLERIAARGYLAHPSFPETEALFQTLTRDSFFLRARQFRVDSARITSAVYDYYPILGFSGTSYYVPIRVLHQFGMDPAPAQPPHGEEDSLPSSYSFDSQMAARGPNRDMRRLTERLWIHAQLLAIPPPQDPDPEQEETRLRNFRLDGQRRWVD